MNKKVIAVIGAGNGGQALAGHISSMGYKVRLFDRDENKVKELNENKKIQLLGALQVEGEIDFATTDISKAIYEAELILVATTATAHRSIAKQLSPHLQDNQVLVLNPGRTCGALEFQNTLKEYGLKKRIFIAEAQTLIYACRLITNGKVNIIGVKDKVFISAIPASDTPYVLETLKPMFSCFYPAKNSLQTSFENVGAIFHPAVVLFNAAAIERGNKFYFYRDMTDGLARLIENIDNERIAVAKSYGIQLLPVFEWVSYAYNGVEGKTLCERMQNNPAYYEILAPTTIDCRQITEDIPTGIIPISELGKNAKVATPHLDALITMCSTLLNRDFREEGRTLRNLGLENLTKEEILEKIN